jgi:hypothetical protein
VQPGVTVENASIAGMPNGSSRLVEVTSAGVLEHDVRNANGSWQAGWGEQAGSTGIVQASITALPNGSSEILAVITAGTLELNTRFAKRQLAGLEQGRAAGCRGACAGHECMGASTVLIQRGLGCPRDGALNQLQKLG